MYSSSGEVKYQWTVPFLRYVITEMGENAMALKRVRVSDGQTDELWFLTPDTDKIKKKTLFLVKTGMLGTIWSSLPIICRV